MNYTKEKGQMAEFDEFWAKHIETYEAIPAYFRDTVERDISGEEPFPYIIYCPSDRYGWRATNEKLLCLTGKSVLFYERIQNTLQTKRFCFDEIIMLEEGHVLLFSWIKIAGISNGIHDTIFIEFNSVMERLFIKVLNTLRKEINQIDAASCSADLDKFNYLYNVDFKFGNHGKSSILGDVKVLCIAYQKKRKIKKFLFFYKNIIPESYIVVLTDKELIVVADKDAKKYSQIKAGSVWTYCPICRVTEIQLSEGNCEETNELIINIESEKIQRIFHQSNVNSFFDLQTIFKKESAAPKGESDIEV
jgi:hypothetical protein